MWCVKSESAGRRFLLLSMLGCALMLAAAWAPGAATLAQAASAPAASARAASAPAASSQAAAPQDAGSPQEIQVISRAGQKQMLDKPGVDAVGAHDPDVIVVEYFDYNCPFCKQLVPTLHALLEQEPKIAILYKDWPILGDVSVYAASCALAAGYQGKYQVAHDALISGPRLAHNDQVDTILGKAGVNMDTLKKDRVAHAKEIAALLERNDVEAHALALDGTPGLVIGRQLVPGIADVKYLKGLVANSRHIK
jgi:protein-disulfide isomerase